MNKKTIERKLDRYRFQSKLNKPKMKDNFIKIFQEHDNKFFTENKLYSFLENAYYSFYNQKLHKNELSDLINSLILWDILDFYCFNNKKKIYYFGNNPNLLLNVLSINFENAFLSHYTASCVYRLTDPVEYIYMTNLYQSKTDKKRILEQNAINKAFNGKMRKAKNGIIINNSNNTVKKTLYLLSQYSNISKYSLYDLGIVEKKFDNFSIPISSYEKLLIEAAVRPSYFPNLESIINVYYYSKKYIDCERLLKILNNLNHTYPYHQSIGFLLEITNYDQDQVALLESLPINFDFYLVYESNKYNLSYSEKWHLYYPTEILNYIKTVKDS